jgi:hypothetical protein
MNQPTGKDTAYLLPELVPIPSVNPAFCAPDENPEIFGEQRVSHFLGEFFQQIGCKVWLRMEQTPPKSPRPEHRVWSSALATEVVIEAVKHLDQLLRGEEQTKVVVFVERIESKVKWTEPARRFHLVK